MRHGAALANLLIDVAFDAIPKEFWMSLRRTTASAMGSDGGGGGRISGPSPSGMGPPTALAPSAQLPQREAEARSFVFSHPAPFPQS